MLVAERAGRLIISMNISLKMRIKTKYSHSQKRDSSAYKHNEYFQVKKPLEKEG